MEGLVEWQIWRDLPSTMRYGLVIGSYWGTFVVIDTLVVAALQRWRPLSGWMMLAENAALALFFFLAGRWIELETAAAVYVEVFIVKALISTAADRMQTRQQKTLPPDNRVTLAVASLRAAGACLALAGLAYAHGYILHELSFPFLLLTLIDLVIWAAIHPYRRLAPFVIVLENAALIELRAFLESWTEGPLPGSYLIGGFIIVKSVGSLIAIAADRGVRGHRPTALRGRQMIWFVARLSLIPLLFAWL